MTLIDRFAPRRSAGRIVPVPMARIVSWVKRERGEAARPEPAYRGCPRNCKRRASPNDATDGATAPIGKAGARRSSREPGDLPVRVAHLPCGARGRADHRCGDCVVSGVVATVCLAFRVGRRSHMIDPQLSAVIATWTLRRVAVNPTAHRVIAARRSLVREASMRRLHVTRCDDDRRSSLWSRIDACAVAPRGAVAQTQLPGIVVQGGIAGATAGTACTGSGARLRQPTAQRVARRQRSSGTADAGGARLAVRPAAHPAIVSAGTGTGAGGPGAGPAADGYARRNRRHLRSRS